MRLALCRHHHPGEAVKLDLDYLEDKTRYAMSTPTTVIAKAELAALVKIVRAASETVDHDTSPALCNALDEAGLL